MKNILRMYRFQIYFVLSIAFLQLTIKQSKAATPIHISKEPFSMSGRILVDQIPDELTILIWTDIYFEDRKTLLPHRTMNCPVINGKFNIKVDSIERNSVISIGWGYDNGAVVEHYSTNMAEAGDCLQITIGKNKSDLIYKFEGDEANKFKCEYELKKVWHQRFSDWKSDSSRSSYNDPSKYLETLSNLENGNSVWEYCLSGQLKVLSQYRDVISKASFDKLKSIILVDFEYRKLKTLNQILEYTKHSNGDDNLHNVSGRARILLEQNSIDTTTSIYPNNYSNYLMQKFEAEVKLNNAPNAFEIIKTLSSNKLRDKLLFENLLLNSWRWDAPLRDKIEKESLKLTTTRIYRELIESRMKEKKGTLLYNFSLPNKFGKFVNLIDFKGKVLFIDFWFVSCGACATYFMNIVSKVEEQFKYNKDVVFITISIDTNKEAWLEGLASGKFTTDKAVNLYTPLGVKDPLIQQLEIQSYPHPVLIDRNGRIFSDSKLELRSKGTTGLSQMIEKALIDSLKN